MLDAQVELSQRSGGFVGDDGALQIRPGKALDRIGRLPEGDDDELDRVVGRTFARRVVVVCRIENRIGIARAVIDERMSTAEALERFHALEASRPDFIASSGKESRLEKEDRLGRALRCYVEELLEKQSECKAVVLERLDRDLHEHLRKSADRECPSERRRVQEE